MASSSSLHMTWPKTCRCIYFISNRLVRRAFPIALATTCIILIMVLLQNKLALNNVQEYTLQSDRLIGFRRMVSVSREETVYEDKGKAQRESNPGAKDTYNKVGKQQENQRNVTKKTRYLRYFAESRRNTFPLSVRPDPYAINNQYVCRSSKDLDLLILVISASEHFHTRHVVRTTWGDVKNYPNHQIRVVFLLGLSNNDSVNAQINKENSANKDIVQGNFNDSYRNLTHKAVMGMRWTLEYCPNAKLVVKVDDDTFVNMFKLLDDMYIYKNKSKEIFCYKRDANSSIIQRTEGQWPLSLDFFRNMTHFPFPHCNGFFVIFSADIIKPLYEASKIAPFIWMDDVYLTGLVPEIIGGIQLTALDSLMYYEAIGFDCFKSQKKRCNLLAMITYSRGVLEYLWNSIQANRKLPLA